MPNQPRLPFAAKTLLAEVEALGHDPSVLRLDRDGFNVDRTLVLTSSETSSWLETLLHLVDDPRIVWFEQRRGRLIVTFTHRPASDSRDSFDLADADVVARG